MEFTFTLTIILPQIQIPYTTMTYIQIVKMEYISWLMEMVMQLSIIFIKITFTIILTMEFIWKLVRR